MATNPRRVLISCHLLSTTRKDSHEPNPKICESIQGIRKNRQVIFETVFSVPKNRVASGFSRHFQVPKKLFSPSTHQTRLILGPLPCCDRLANPAAAVAPYGPNDARQHKKGTRIMCQPTTSSQLFSKIRVIRAGPQPKNSLGIAHIRHGEFRTVPHIHSQVRKCKKGFQSGNCHFLSKPLYEKSPDKFTSLSKNSAIFC